jgi:tetratricopeptide (TPR) repeat protein
VFINRALERPMFGWDGWGRNIVKDEHGYTPGIDSLWVITFGCFGLVGLILVNTAMLLPVLLLLVRFPVAQWISPALAPATALAVILNLFMIDCLFNSMPNGIYMIIAGGLVGMAAVSQAGAETSALSVNDSRGNLAARYRAAGRAAKDQGRFAEAKASWLRALDLLAGQTPARFSSNVVHQQWCDCANDLAWLLVNVPDPSVRDIDTGVALAVKATEMQPDLGGYWNTVGAAYYRAGDFTAAIAALNRAVSLGNGGTAFDHVFLAMANAQLGDHEQSARWLALAIAETEKNYPGHRELTRFCNEARSLVAAGPDAYAHAPLN